MSTIKMAPFFGQDFESPDGRAILRQPSVAPGAPKRPKFTEEIFAVRKSEHVSQLLAEIEHKIKQATSGDSTRMELAKLRKIHDFANYVHAHFGNNVGLEEIDTALELLRVAEEGTLGIKHLEGVPEQLEKLVVLCGDLGEILVNLRIMRTTGKNFDELSAWYRETANSMGGAQAFPGLALPGTPPPPALHEPEISVGAAAPRPPHGSWRME